MVDFAAPNPNSLLQLANSPLLPRFYGRRLHPRWRFKNSTSPSRASYMLGAPATRRRHTRH